MNQGNGRVAGKVALITGGAKGIGAASARLLVAQGPQVLGSDIDERAGLALVERLGSAASFIIHHSSDGAQ